ncbi:MULTISPECIES: DUF5305 domain-containing protein [Salinibaculum]|uniref:DUF5305 domain-containing protein n=1 Tax=Salinibaculum TaxID=2732368 RepID=UPI0030CCA9A3
MSTRERRVRVRATLDRYFLPVLAVVLVLGLVGGYVAYGAYATDATRTETRQIASWESTGSFTHSATVVNDTAVYDEGDVLRNRTSYFRQLTPRLDGTFAYTYRASGGGNLSVNATTALVLRSATEADGGEEQGQGTEYWRLESVLGSRQVDGLSPGDRLRVPFSVNVSAAAARLDRVDEQFGTTPGQKQVRVETRLSLTGTRNGQPVDRTRTYRLSVGLGNGIYEVTDAGPTTDSDEQTEQVTVPVEPGPLRAYGGPLLAVVSLAAAAGLGVARSRGALSVSERERDWLEYRSTRAEFDDWITVASLPEADHPGAAIEVATLEGLVDVAIDTDQRVLEDRTTGVLVVFGEDRTYTYAPPSLPGDDPLAEDDATSGGGEPLADVLEPTTTDGEESADDEENADDDEEPAAVDAADEDGSSGG